MTRKPMPSILSPKHPQYEPRQIQGREIDWMLRRNIWTGVLGSLSVSFMTGGVFFTVYCQRMGMQTYQFGALSTLVYLMFPLVLFSAAIEEHFGRRKYPWVILAMLSRAVLVPLALGLFMRLNPWLIMALVVASVAFSNLGSPLWVSWTWGYIPTGSLGRFTARKSLWVTLVMALFGLCGATLVRYTPSEHQVRVISAMFVVLAVLGFVDLAFHAQIPEPPRESPPARSRTKVWQAVRHAPFRNWLLVMGIWYFALSLGGPFCVPYMMRDLGFGKKMLTAAVLVGVVPAAGSLLTLHFWGRRADVRHPGKVIAACCGVWATIPFFYYVSTPANALWVLGTAWAIAGVFPVVVSVSMPLMTARLSGKDKTMPAALFYVVLQVGGMLGAAVGTYIVHRHGVHSAFMASLAARMTAAFVMFLLLVYRPAKGSGGALSAPA